MHTTNDSRLAPRGLASAAPRVDRRSPQVSAGRRNAQFVDMMMAFRGFGGALRAPEVDARVPPRRRAIDPSDTDAPSEPFRIEFDWDGATWVPLFQFEQDTLRVSPRVMAAKRVLPARFTGWDLALWFAMPNRWLNQRRPVSLVAGEGDRVCAAAGLEQFLC